jgi:hypothetical protein
MRPVRPTPPPLRKVTQGIEVTWQDVRDFLLSVLVAGAFLALLVVLAG